MSEETMVLKCDALGRVTVPKEKLVAKKESFHLVEVSIGEYHSSAGAVELVELCLPSVIYKFFVQNLKLLNFNPFSFIE